MDLDIVSKINQSDVYNENDDEKHSFRVPSFIQEIVVQNTPINLRSETLSTWKDLNELRLLYLCLDKALENKRFKSSELYELFINFIKDCIDNGMGIECNY